jgi:hypothetical protein
LAALAYSPSDAMSQAGICLAGIQKVQPRSHRAPMSRGMKSENHISWRSGRQRSDIKGNKPVAIGF